MTEIVLTKRAIASKGNDSLDNFSKLKNYAYQGSILVKK